MKDIQFYDIKNNPNKVNVILTNNARKFANEIYILVQGNHFNIDDETKWRFVSWQKILNIMC